MLVASGLAGGGGLPVQALGGRVERRFWLINACTIDVAPAQLAAVRALPGVADVAAPAAEEPELPGWTGEVEHLGKQPWFSALGEAERKAIEAGVQALAERGDYEAMLRQSNWKAPHGAYHTPGSRSK